MKIKTFKASNRRYFVGDFTAVYICEHCGHEVTDYGYDSADFHNNVIPQMQCPECGKAADENYRPLNPQRPE